MISLTHYGDDPSCYWKSIQLYIIKKWNYLEQIPKIAAMLSNFSILVVGRIYSSAAWKETLLRVQISQQSFPIDLQ